MKNNFTFTIVILMLILGIGFAVDANAQTKRRKVNPRRAARINRPPTVVTMQTLEPAVISRAEDELQPTVNPDGSTGAAVNTATGTASRTQTSGGSANRTNGANSQKDDESLKSLERLTLAESRAEGLRQQLNDILERESSLKAKLDQLDYQARPDTIEREAAVIGSLRPEEIRESRRKTLENEKIRSKDQLLKLSESRTRLEAAVASADALVDKLRVRVDTENGTSTTAAPPAKNNSNDSNGDNSQPQ